MNKIENIKTDVTAAPMVRLGDYIVARNERNTNLIYGPELIEGVNSDGEFVPTKAKLDGIDMKPYKVVRKGDFVYNPSRLNIGSLSYRDKDNMCIVSHLYVVFHIKEEKKIKLLPEFLRIFFMRDEFLRMVDYYNFGSQRAEFNIHDISEFYIPLPPIETQRKYVDAYNGLKQLAEQNEAMIEPLKNACNASVSSMRKKYKMVEIGSYLKESDERNTDLSVKLSQGISNLKYFQDPKQVAENSKSDKIVRRGQFAYNRATTRNGEKISIAYRDGDDCTVSSAYGVFSITDENILNPYYLLMWFKRPEFDRYARYKSKGSAHEFFEFDEMCRVRIPLPPLEVQRSIVSLYQCAEEARSIAAEARKTMREMCPAMVRKSSLPENGANMK